MGASSRELSNPGEPIDGIGEGTTTDSVFLLRGGDGDRDDADSNAALRRHTSAHCPQRGLRDRVSAPEHVTKNQRPVR